MEGAFSHKIVERRKRSDSEGEHFQDLARLTVPRAVVLHGTSCFHRNESIPSAKRDINTIYFGRYMLERNRLQGGFSSDEYYVVHCASLVSE
jgi:hypothetical protein